MSLTNEYNRNWLRWLSRSHLAALLAAVFLSAQFLATAHAAAYGDAAHMHDGTPCIIAATHKQNDQLDVTKPLPSLDREATHSFVEIARSMPALNRQENRRSIRGPPTFS